MRSSVVIVSYRPGDWLGPCVASAMAAADEVVVVDNGSEGAAAGSVARRLGARVVATGRNLGFAGGAAAGMAAAMGDLIGVLNDDATADASWLSSAAAVLSAPGAADVGAVTPKVLLAGTWAEVVLDDPVWHSPGDARDLGRMVRSVAVDGAERLDRVVGVGIHRLETAGDDCWRWTAGPLPFYVPAGAGAEVTVDGEPVSVRATVALLNHAGAYLHPDGVGGEIGFATPDDGRADAAGEVFGFSGTAPVFTREALERVGGFAPQFFAYNEDTDWCLRARLAGLRVAYDPTAVVHHRLSATSGGTASARVRMLVQRNAVLCLARNAPWPVVAGALRDRWPHTTWEVRREVGRLLPWALASRAAAARSWATRPAEVWQRWVGVGAEFDRGPAHVGAT